MSVPGEVTYPQVCFSNVNVIGFKNSPHLADAASDIEIGTAGLPAMA